MSKFKETCDEILKTSINEEFEGYEYDKTFDMEIPIPAFTIKTKVNVNKPKYSKPSEGAYKNYPVAIEIETFKNNIEKVLNEVVPPALIKAVDGKIPDKLDATSFEIGSWGASFPITIHVKIKEKK